MKQRKNGASYQLAREPLLQNSRKICMRKQIITYFAMILLATPTALWGTPTDSTLNALRTSKTLELQAKSRLWLWQHEDGISPSLMFQYRPAGPLPGLPSFNAASFSRDARQPALDDFQNSTDYLKDYAQWELSSEIAKGSQPLMLSFRKLAQAVGKLFKKDAGKYENLPRNFVLSDQEIDMLQAIWRQPNISTTEWYTAYNHSAQPPKLPFLLFEQAIRGLVRQGLVRQQRVKLNFIDTLKKPRYRYAAVFKFKTILQYLREALVFSDALGNGRRHFDLLRMKARLTDSAFQTVN